MYVCVCFAITRQSFFGKRFGNKLGILHFLQTLDQYIFDVNYGEASMRARKIVHILSLRTQANNLDLTDFLFSRFSPRSTYFSAYIFVASITFVFFVAAYVKVAAFRDVGCYIGKNSAQACQQRRLQISPGTISSLAY